MGAALLWGAVAASSLVVGALLGLAWRWPPVLVGAVLAFGADGTRYACGSAVSPVTDPFFKGLCASLPETRKALSLGWLLGAAALVAGGAYLDGAGRREIAEEIDEEKAAENPEVSAP